MIILVAGATGSIGHHVVNSAIEMGHQPVALVRNKRSSWWLNEVKHSWILPHCLQTCRLMIHKKMTEF